MSAGSDGSGDSGGSIFLPDGIDPEALADTVREHAEARARAQHAAVLLGAADEMRRKLEMVAGATEGGLLAINALSAARDMARAALLAAGCDLARAEELMAPIERIVWNMWDAQARGAGETGRPPLSWAVATRRAALAAAMELLVQNSRPEDDAAKQVAEWADGDAVFDGRGRDKAAALVDRWRRDARGEGKNSHARLSEPFWKFVAFGKKHGAEFIVRHYL
ncbi:hypothetical protein RGI145_08585 [Roseomonas gilardii]|uniref:Uncharacterized protein n=1 Tax=Roseomonas gilardii TaxID=257708 RepID=A0A1L7AEG7_9PROT|nr:hypothetical protein [Roseomonas gilardii]APT57143.1 hypothetical protein RGI145_08585 [Roseomonas gilardii]